MRRSTSPSGGVPATRMYGGFGPEPEGGNPNDVFIDNDEADDDEVDPIALTVGLGPPPDDDDDVFIDDDDDNDVVDPAIAADATPTAGSSAQVVPPDARHACPVAGCSRRSLSDPRGLRRIFGRSDTLDLCCDICLFTDGHHHTNICDFTNPSSTAAPSATTAVAAAAAPVVANLTTAPSIASAPPSSGNSEATPTLTPTPTPTPTTTHVFPARVDGEHCRGCHICVRRTSRLLPIGAVTLCHCSCGQCEYGVYESCLTDQGGLCDFCFSEWEFVPQHQTYVNGCHCDCDGCYRGRERLGILFDDESWIGHHTNDGEDPDSVFSTLQMGVRVRRLN